MFGVLFFTTKKTSDIQNTYAKQEEEKNKVDCHITRAALQKSFLCVFEKRTTHDD